MNTRIGLKRLCKPDCAHRHAGLAQSPQSLQSSPTTQSSSRFGDTDAVGVRLLDAVAEGVALGDGLGDGEGVDVRDGVRELL